jgi:hypothetical protein
VYTSPLKIVYSPKEALIQMHDNKIEANVLYKDNHGKRITIKMKKMHSIYRSISLVYIHTKPALWQTEAQAFMP